MLEVKELVKTFGDFKGVHLVSFRIPDGKILGLIDQNG
ncbi:sodium ABC transporter ATP-binding protein, partial [Enterococcus faecalis]